ncbi:fimbrial protein [Dyella flava]|uniref:Type 1 fimbrial protein n=1 Tax=Dyella flava TaxID=1920170 RepID=A0ABS2K7G5_9GAMM|nr:fimbrial protein [Dyella flava]MBM7127094.1 type 1 fimbrial protein [Dyella flava]GLQ50145.1 fimbrial protein [Dyella flava]
MKKIKLGSALAVMGLAVAGGAANAADGGVITFHGVVTDTTCTVQGGSGTDGGVNNFSVALNGVDANILDRAAKTANATAFQVLVGGPDEPSCGAGDGKVASMSFLASSPQVDGATGNLNNLLTNEAGNVQVQLLQRDGSTAIDLRDPNKGLQSANIVNHQATLQYYAQYYATAAATPGLLETNVVYAVNYN